MWRFALIGYGLAGRYFHRPLIQSVAELDLTHVVTSNAERRAEAGGDAPGAVLVPTADELWTRADEFDVVVIATANDAHVPLARQAIDLGKPVVVDKPMALTRVDAQQLEQHAARSGVLLAPFHNRRWDSDTLTIRQLLDSNVLGTVHRFETRFQRFRPEVTSRWRESDPSRGGGVLLDLGTHLIDQAMHLFGPVARVHADIGVRRSSGVADDDAVMMLEHRGGVRSYLWCSLVAPIGGPRVVVEGSSAGYAKETLDGQEDALRAGWNPADGPWGSEPAGRLVTAAGESPTPSVPGRWSEFYAQLAAALAGEGSAPVAAQDAVSVAAVIDAARASARDAAVVELPT